MSARRVVQYGKVSDFPVMLLDLASDERETYLRTGKRDGESGPSARMPVSSIF